SFNGQNGNPFGWRDETSGSGTNASVNWTKNLSARAFSNFTLSFNRNESVTLPYFQSLGVNTAQQLGMLGTSPDPRNFGPPTLTFTNYQSLNDANSSTAATTTFTISENYTYRVGKHNLSWGGGWTKNLNNSITVNNGRGTFTFTGLSTSNFGANGQPITGT